MFGGDKRPNWLKEHSILDSRFRYAVRKYRSEEGDQLIIRTRIQERLYYTGVIEAERPYLPFWFRYLQKMAQVMAYSVQFSRADCQNSPSHVSSVGAQPLQESVIY